MRDLWPFQGRRPAASMWPMEWAGMALATPALVLLIVAAVVAGQLAARIFVQASEPDRRRRPS